MQVHPVQPSAPPVPALHSSLAAALALLAALFASFGIALGIAPPIVAAVLEHIVIATTFRCAPNHGAPASYRRSLRGDHTLRPLPHPT